ncbi:hypothetical protein Cni_G29499 [Canna indica]|uniref:Uncharacterized protein n=1 Tax=Canna indica TaxID=4628 RepID=A0AAQ3L8H3_9LILI|nr:hypothetical protein Cni_G29499 [Canna indica]
MDRKEDNNAIITEPLKKSKKRSTLRIMRAAIAALSLRSSKKKKRNNPSTVADATALKSLVDGMRPLHVQLDENQRQLSLLLPPPSPAWQESFHEVPSSPASSWSWDDEMSSYTSAEDLWVLDAEEDYVIDGRAEEDLRALDAEEDHAIDARAEEFIARFYEKLRLEMEAALI